MKTICRTFIIIAAIFLSSCSKEILRTTHIDGAYSGVLEIVNADSSAKAPAVKGRVIVNLDGINYTCSTNMNYAYAGGSGKFFVKKDVMTFTDILVHPASFDWNLVLNGSYTYRIVGTHITLVKKVGNKTFTYRLNKQ
jgi:hypothetical protein